MNISSIGWVFRDTAPARAENVSTAKVRTVMKTTMTGRPATTKPVLPPTPVRAKLELGGGKIGTCYVSSGLGDISTRGDAWKIVFGDIGLGDVGDIAGFGD